ncbi:MAG: FAD-dependent oxidoreductase [Verrucomicrobiales bacterium]|jgi:hypothetical protein|nr:FAD-dependent oxidoreductase [Verrucomicrobiales bacterium]
MTDFIRPHYYAPEKFQPSTEVTACDLFIYGATSGGITAAVEGVTQGLRVVLADVGARLGGLTASGLGQTDFGNKGAIGGLAAEFYRRVGKHYGQPEAWTWEPHVAQQVFAEWVREHGIVFHPYQALAAVEKDGNRIVSARMENGHVFKARVFIDATYEGDLLARAGVTYTVGREPMSQYGELYAGVQFGHPNHNFRLFVDPYVKRGDRHSGLLPEITDADPGRQGDGDRCIQAYNFRFCLTQEPSIRQPFPKPAGYDPQRYELLGRHMDEAVFEVFRLSSPMPNGKTDTNNFGAFATDYIGGNYRWPEAGYAERERILQAHLDYSAGLFWFLANDPRVPRPYREFSARFGLCVDEFTETGGWPHQLYIREARRMVSAVVLTEHHCVRRDQVSDSVGLGSYGMDSHNCRRLVWHGRALNEGNVEIHGFPPYGISYRAIVPREAECANLLVPWCVSASHIAYGSIRMEPVFMVLGQSAAVAAKMALEEGVPVQQVPYADLRSRLLAKGQVLELDWQIK